VIESLAVVGLTDTGRVVVEKPFGRDLQSAKDLNRVLHEHLAEEQVFRIDHYLGKESVEDLLVFRFANTFLEPIWNRNYVASVQITMAESIGVEGRGSFYDSVGAIRDVVQNHLLQVVALLAMEPPVGPEAKHLSDEKMKVFSAMRSLDAAHLVRGQYEGYRDEPGVDPHSEVETYAAVRLEIDSWRWAGVPFYVRAGKAMATSVTEAVVVLREPPALLFDESGPPGPQPNLIRFRLGKADGVTFTVNAKTPGPSLDSEPVELGVDFGSVLGERHEAYERLIHDALDGNPRRFGRFDIVEETWRIVEPILGDTRPPTPYARESWGPGEADRLLEGSGTWHSCSAPSTPAASNEARH
jgi:glucose-6-phosphate 1-dehydrogenase